jgi:hypothetical protein
MLTPVDLNLQFLFGLHCMFSVQYTLHEYWPPVLFPASAGISPSTTVVALRPIPCPWPQWKQH